MNKLSEDILYNIYNYKHQLEYTNTMDELSNIRLRCRFNLTLSALYRDYHEIPFKCVYLDDIDVSSFELLK